MRRPTVADVLEAVTHVSGVDPLTEGRYPRTIASRRLACHALREIAECSYPEAARALGYADHTSVMHQCRQPVDWDALRAVLVRVNQMVHQS